MRAFLKAGLMTAATLIFGVTAASAEVVCNSNGDCWKTTERHSYGPELKLRVMPNDWKWADNEKDKYRWRDAGKGRGYYDNKGAWLEIK